ncbi:hypothetical protein WA026_013914 [Henosepilachna vigintioctopunctata]|uniref:Uncharacterized protein n=1 Tax=Henosepilachna vigintioctopunctata TaxID=420089 RepID=A0AAW1U6H8_9CUCU
MENICRTCLRTQADASLCSLFEQKDLLNRIREISSVELSDVPGYPTKICIECRINVNKLGKSIRNRRDDTDDEDEKPLIFIKTELENANYNEHANNEENTWSPDLDTGNNDHDSFHSEDDSNKKEDEQIQEDDDCNSVLLPIKKCACNECGIEFTSRFKLYNHRRTNHVVPGICNICGIVVRADNLRRHVQLHSEGPASCHHCGKVFKNSESLRGHLLIHRGHIFTCEKCGKTSKVRAEHRRHMKTHSDPEIGKMMCNICGKKVRDLKKHMHSHTGERPHICSFCQKGFTSPYALKVHTRQHTNERPYVCTICQSAYPQKVSLVSHLKSKHGIKYENPEST